QPVGRSGGSKHPMADPSTAEGALSWRDRPLPWLGLALVAQSGCPATGEDVRPPQDQFFLPAALAIAPDESVLFVANSNSELRYDSGTVGVIDLDQVDALVAEWKAGGAVPGDTADCSDCCERHPELSYVLICNEKRVILRDSTVR